MRKWVKKDKGLSVALIIMVSWFIYTIIVYEKQSDLIFPGTVIAFTALIFFGSIFRNLRERFEKEEKKLAVGSMSGKYYISLIILVSISILATVLMFIASNNKYAVGLIFIVWLIFFMIMINIAEKCRKYS